MNALATFLLPLLIVIGWLVGLLMALEPEDDDTDEWEDPIEVSETGGGPVGAWSGCYGVQEVRA